MASTPNFFGGSVPADIDNSKASYIYGALITVTILATIAVVLRFVARRKSNAPFSYGK